MVNAETVRVVSVTPIPGADRIELAHVFGWSVVVPRGVYAPGSLATYIPPDSLVPLDRPEFGHLSAPRIKAKRIRGATSFGLLVDAVAGAVEGDDVSSVLGVTHYEPPVRFRGASKPRPNDEAPGPSGVTAPKYDVENGRRWAHTTFIPGETVVVHEKIHGANARYVYADGTLHCGSRTSWKKPGSMWHRAAEKTSGLLAFCIDHPGHVVYGEVFGQVQDLKYDRELDFLAFDVLTPVGSWWDHGIFIPLPWVPLLYVGPYDFETCCSLAEGQSRLASHVREGCVVRTIRERVDAKGNRALLKFVGEGYYSRKETVDAVG